MDGLAQGNQGLLGVGIYVWQVTQLLESHCFQSISGWGAQPVNGAAIDEGRVGPETLPAKQPQQTSMCW